MYRTIEMNEVTNSLRSQLHACLVTLCYYASQFLDLKNAATTLILDRDVFEVCQSKKNLSTVNVN